MEILLKKTEDGSSTLFIPELNENYHSSSGAISESMHVYINSGLKNTSKSDINILEIGFGTGLNLLLTFLENKNLNRKILYETVELFPVDIELVKSLNYSEELSIKKDFFEGIHTSEWGKLTELDSSFTYKKIKADIIDFIPDKMYDLVYFDAFAPDKQPKLWTFDIFNKIYAAMNPEGILITYSSKGTVKQALRKSGFEVKRLAGFGGKRHIVKATKNLIND